MPSIARDEIIQQSIAANFQSYNWLGKLQMICTMVPTMVLVFIPELLMDAITGKRKPNQGRLLTVIPNQIYQQKYARSGQNNATILKSKKGDALLIHTAPSITPEFLKDIQALGAPVKYIYISNEVHDTFASDCKEAFPNAKMLTPKVCKEAIAQCVPTDDVCVVEEYMQALEEEFGVIKVFNADQNVQGRSADRSWALELYSLDDKNNKEEKKKKQCLFVGQCGYGHCTKFNLLGYLTGFQGFMQRGRFFRSFYWAFAKNHSQIRPYWIHMVKSCDHLHAAVFQHGDPIVGENTQQELLKFYVY